MQFPSIPKLTKPRWLACQAAIILVRGMGLWGTKEAIRPAWFAIPRVGAKTQRCYGQSTPATLVTTAHREAHHCPIYMIWEGASTSHTHVKGLHKILHMNNAALYRVKIPNSYSSIILLLGPTEKSEGNEQDFELLRALLQAECEACQLHKMLGKVYKLVHLLCLCTRHKEHSRHQVG